MRSEFHTLIFDWYFWPCWR